MGSVEWFLTWLEQNRLPVPIIVEEVRQDRVKVHLRRLAVPEGIGTTYGNFNLGLPWRGALGRHL